MKTPKTIIEKAEYIAVHIMGWERDQHHCWTSNNKMLQHVRCAEFNPHKDWNHWRAIEEKIMEGDTEHGSLHAKFLKNIHDAMYDTEIDYRWVDLYMKADLPTRVNCLIAAHKSL